MRALIRTLLVVALLVLTGCAPAQYDYVPVPMDCAADGIDNKLCEFNCRSTGGTWLGTECKR